MRKQGWRRTFVYIPNPDLKHIELTKGLISQYKGIPLTAQHFLLAIVLVIMSSQGFFFQQTPPAGLRVAQLVGITASTFLFGQNASLSFITIPSIMLAPAPIAIKQWASAYNTGHIVGPALALLSTLSTGYLAYYQDHDSLAFKLNLAATIIVPSMIPFTYAFIVTTNDALFKKLDSLATTAVEDKTAELGVAREETVHGLLDKWASLNLARALLVGVGAVTATWASVSKLEVTGFSDVALKSGANRLG